MLTLEQAIVRCDYESTAATQAPDYSYRSVFAQAIDQAQRRNDLQLKCMRAQGYAREVVRTVDSGRSQSPAVDWKALEDDLDASKKQRATARQRLTANPDGPDSPKLVDEIDGLNAKVRDLERKLSYARTPPVSTDPHVETRLLPPASSAKTELPQPMSTPALEARGAGRALVAAKEVAEKEHCNISPAPVLNAASPSFEVYSVACSSGDSLTVRCEVGGSRALR